MTAPSAQPTRNQASARVGGRADDEFDDRAEARIASIADRSQTADLHPGAEDITEEDSPRFPNRGPVEAGALAALVAFRAGDLSAVSKPRPR